MKREDINIRDPFILPYEGKYYLYGSRGSEVWEDNATGLDVYVSDDLENWSEPKEIFTRTADLQSAPFGRSGTPPDLMVPTTGIELVTY